MATIPQGNRPPFGYAWQDGELVIVSEEAPIYEEMFDLFLVHQRKRSVAKHLNEKGYRTRAGKKFGYSTISRLLQNPIAKGVHRVCVTRKNGEREWVETPVPAIVSEEVWEQANAIMNTGSAVARKPSQDVFVGKVICCDQQMDIPARSTSYVCFKCKSDIAIGDVHEIFKGVIKDFPYPDQVFLDELAGAEVHDSEPVVKANIADLELKIEKLYELHSADAITIGVFKDRFTVLNAQLTELKCTLEQAEKPKTKYSTLLDYWNAIDQKSQQILVDTLVHEIRSSAHNIDISLFPLFNFDKLGTGRGV